ncbi:sugar phosphate isomerase/epimerase family protein [Yeosuana sp.]|uniref:sugar phosphate isomerase/epimerase family protein n=1 Tax=Yeosuana sp. TaxID=2529388 RepID=UPI004054C925|tara:strand:+ start:4792 stop:5760 length:969 start_codon:yes stop_codon:yes gene_type:complete
MKSNLFKIIKSALFLVLFLLFIISCKNQEKKSEEVISNTTEKKAPFFKLSLAQWSLHKAINEGETLDPVDFAQKASSFGFEGIEYVSQLYKKKIETIGMDSLLNILNTNSKKYKVKNLLIMVDGEGDLASVDELKRDEAVENHKKWVDAAAFLGCHSIRVNLSGTFDPEIWKVAAFDGLSKLASYAAEQNINVIVENHGGLSSNAAMLVGVIQKVNTSNCGVLPDFGNFCIKKVGSECVDDYDRYKGVEEMMPYAKAVSAKSYAFDKNGFETTIDYAKMLQIVKNAGYTGFIGVEFEGSEISEEEGIKLTKELLLKVEEQLL